MRDKKPLPAGILRTRAEEQRHVNDAFVKGDITKEEWRRATDELSDLSLWSAEGKVKK
jgi:hypothetical protein